jgi:hypothetical protein
MTREEIHKLPWKAQEYINKLERKLNLTDDGNCPFEAYAVFCIECDRKGLKPIKYKDYLNLG